MEKQKISISVYPGQIDALTSVLAGLENNIDPENTDLEVIDNGTDVAEQFTIMQIVSDFHCRTRGVGFYQRVKIPAVRLNVVQVEIKLLNPAAKVPDYKHLTDSGMDVASIENVTIAPRSFAKIKTGIAVGLPGGYELQVRPRSGLQCVQGIVGGWGTVDEGYRGDVGVVLYNHTDEPFEVKVGDRIAQVVVAPVTRAKIKVVDEFEGSTDRGDRGFGSTGK